MYKILHLQGIPKNILRLSKQIPSSNSPMYQFIIILQTKSFKRSLPNHYHYSASWYQITSLWHYDPNSVTQSPPKVKLKIARGSREWLSL